MQLGMVPCGRKHNQNRIQELEEGLPYIYRLTNFMCKENHEWRECVV
jgi:hypothetical protein